MTGPHGGGAVAAHVFVKDLERPALDTADHHHLARVLRLRPGDPLSVSDGCGRWRRCRFGDTVEVSGPVVTETRPQPRLTIGFALVKGERPELIVQKLTELGIDRIAPFVADRSVVRWDAPRGHKHIQRLRRVSREAAMQSRRVWLPEVADVAHFRDLVAKDRGSVALAEREGQRPSLLCRTILIGPEGGWSQAELALSVPTVALGDQILRAETAAITAASIITALRSGLVRMAD